MSRARRTRRASSRPAAAATLTDSVGVVQVGSLALAPNTKLKSDELGASAALDGGAGVTSGNNSVDPSAGVIQVARRLRGADARCRDRRHRLGLAGGSGGIAGGDNTANDSAGVVQIGGGNTSNGFDRRSPVRGAERIAGRVGLIEPTGTTTGVGGTGSIAGGGNTADSSIGAAQIGGGNDSTGSAGAAQAGTVAASPNATAGSNAGGASGGAGGSTAIGGGRNAAGSSIAAMQIGGGNNSTGSAGTTQGGGVSGSPSATGTAGGTSGSLGGSNGIGGGGNTSDGLDRRDADRRRQQLDGFGRYRPVECADALADRLRRRHERRPDRDLGGTGSGSNTATNSIGVGQVGTQNTAGQSVGLLQLGPTAVGGTPGGGTTPPGGEHATSDGGGRLASEWWRHTSYRRRNSARRHCPGRQPGHRHAVTREPVGTIQVVPTPSRSATAGRSHLAATPVKPYQPTTAAGTESEHPALPAVLSSKLPFTGLALWIALVIAGGLLGAGMGLRKLAPHAVAAKTRGLRMRPEAPRLPV